MKHIPYLLVPILAILLLACEKNSLGTIDVPTESPFLSTASATPDSIFLDNLVPVGNLYQVSTVVSVGTAATGRAQEVVAAILRPTTTEEVARISLRDDGSAPDVTANDGIFSGKFDFAIPRTLAGRYRIKFWSTSQDGHVSNIIERRLALTRRNSAPRLLSATSPDTVDLPTTGFITVQFTATVSDSDGLADIAEVFFLRDTLTTKFFLKDDGGIGRNTFEGFPTPLSTGDDVAGDGKYSILLPVTPSNTRSTRLITFQAIDSQGDTSNTIQRFFTIR
ncbi:MAG: hypothetical protein KF749_15035 [Bacteroidetes bacterium]|nr:hypothetical protein [Bacteroidota bacterium]MCW5897329.1 hypothetical protein [Bacteroidota bacterium]